MEITRYYFALTNFCNRSCELCSCHSDPYRKTNLDFDSFVKIVSSGVPYEAQLEGGEPTIHPDFWKMVDYLMNDEFCKKVILCTNAVMVPTKRKNKVIQHDESIVAIKNWLMNFIKKPFVLKPSVNSHLIRHSDIHMPKMKLIQEAFHDLPFLDGSQLIYNVRRIPKPLSEDDELWITDQLKEMNLYQYCNDFLYQRYGKAKDEDVLDLPFIANNAIKFFLISPDGKNFGTDLIGRANHMEDLN